MYDEYPEEGYLRATCTIYRYGTMGGANRSWKMFGVCVPLEAFDLSSMGLAAIIASCIAALSVITWIQGTSDRDKGNKTLFTERVRCIERLRAVCRAVLVYQASRHEVAGPSSNRTNGKRRENTPDIEPFHLTDLGINEEYCPIITYLT